MDLIRRLKNKLAGRKMTVSEKVNYSELVETLNELEEDIVVEVKCLRDEQRETFVKRGREAAQFVREEFLEPNKILYLETQHEVYADFERRKHYFDLKLGIEFERKQSYEDKSLPVKEATITYMRLN